MQMTFIQTAQQKTSLTADWPKAGLAPKPNDDVGAACKFTHC